MIDKIFQMLLKEARTRPGNDIAEKLTLVIFELDGKIVDFMMELDDHLWDGLPGPEELEKVKSPKFDRWIKKKQKQRERGVF